MAVYTKLNFEQINDFLKGYSIGKLKSFKEIVDGIDNSNFIIETDQGKFIFTVFESRIGTKDLPFFMNLKTHLSKKGVCCPKPIVNNDGDLISKINTKSASIVTFLEGKTLKSGDFGYYNNITRKHCEQVGENLAKLHNFVFDFDQKRENDLGIDDWRQYFDKFCDKTEKYQKGLKAEIIGYIDFLEKNWRKDLDSGVVHVDLFPDNVFFDDHDNLSGIIDFYFSAYDLFIYDLAITVNAWCFNGNNDFVPEKFQSMIDSYKKLRQIPQKELDFLNIALVGASLRFLLTRLHDLFNTPEDSLVNVKDPQEYLAKIRFFKNVFGG